MDRYQRVTELQQQLAFRAALPRIITWCVIAILIYVATSIGLMKMFEKAGEKRWKAWIPFYNLYILFKISWTTYWFWPIVGAVVFTAFFGNLKVGNPLATIFAVIIVLLAIGLFVLKVFLSLRVAKAFGKTIPWAIGLIFLDFVFYNLLGWGSAEYDNSVHEESPEFDFSNVKAKLSSSTSTTKKAEAKPKADPKPRVAEKPKAAAKPKKVAKPKADKGKDIPDYIDPKPKAKF